MLRNLKDLENYKIRATDGEIGDIKDFYFEDDAWVVRYLVVDAGSWLASRQVLISPIAIDEPDWAEKTLPVALTQQQVRASPDIDTDKPVSRQQEAQYMGYYSYPYYWDGAGMWGEGMYPYAMAPGAASRHNGNGHANGNGNGNGSAHDVAAYQRDTASRHRNDDPHLRSSKAVTGYAIQATDGEIGHVAGFLVDDETWAIRYLVVDTSNWWMGHKVLVAPPWITGVHWADKTVTVDLSRDAIKNAPPYNADTHWGRDQDLSLYRHHGRSGYWARDAAARSEL
jgi:hypothetical protein